MHEYRLLRASSFISERLPSVFVLIWQLRLVGIWLQTSLRLCPTECLRTWHICISCKWNAMSPSNIRTLRQSLFWVIILRFMTSCILLGFECRSVSDICAMMCLSLVNNWQWCIFQPVTQGCSGNKNLYQQPLWFAEVPLRSISNFKLSAVANL